MSIFGNIHVEINKALESAELQRHPHGLLLACYNVRKKCLGMLASHRDRNVVTYYSGGLHKAGPTPNSLINDRDFSMLASVTEQLDRGKGLDLVLHTPGGEIGAVEKVTEFLLKRFNADIEVFIPELSMSVGTMLACAARCIYMSEESSLGMIDPMVEGFSAHGVLAEYEQARAEVKNDASKIPIWQAVLGKYPPALIPRCRGAVLWSKELTEKWLLNGALAASRDKESKVKSVGQKLCDPNTRGGYTRHIRIEEAVKIGLKVASLEENAELKRLVYQVHHANIHSLRTMPMSKIIENQSGTGFCE